MSTEIQLKYLKSAAVEFCIGTQARVQNSRGKQAISVQAIEVLLYTCIMLIFFC